MPNPKLLVVEDEKNLGSTLSDLLKSKGFELSWVRSCEEARMEISLRKFDLALLDVGLPDGNGFDLAQELRKTRPELAIVFLTAYSNPEDRVKGLELGAEDYMVKPFHFTELVIRIQNALKRATYISDHPREYLVGKARVRLSQYEVESSGQTHSLTHKECALLKLLIDRSGQVVSRDEILNFVWSEDEYPSPRTIDNFILKFRRWFEQNLDEPKVIRSIRGVGYQLVSEEVKSL